MGTPGATQTNLEGDLCPPQVMEFIADSNTGECSDVHSGARLVAECREEGRPTQNVHPEERDGYKSFVTLQLLINPSKHVLLKLEVALTRLHE